MAAGPAATLAPAALAHAALAHAPRGAAREADDLRGVVDERAVIAVADRLDTAVDAKDRDAALARFVDGEIDVDLTAAGGPATRMPAADLVGLWRANLFAEAAI